MAVQNIKIRPNIVGTMAPTIHIVGLSLNVDP
jgi:hypothetical protein